MHNKKNLVSRFNSLGINASPSEAVDGFIYLSEDDADKLVSVQEKASRLSQYITQFEISNVLNDLHKLESALIRVPKLRALVGKLKGFVFNLSDLTTWYEEHD